MGIEGFHVVVRGYSGWGCIVEGSQVGIEGSMWL